MGNYMTLEEHRLITVGEILGLLKNYNRVACVRYTGYGKSYFVIKKLCDILDKYNILILVPNIELRASYERMGVTADVWTYTKFAKTECCNEYNLVIADECHHINHSKWGDRIREWVHINSNLKIIGFTATQIRGDGIDVVDDFFECSTDEMNLQQALSSNYIKEIHYVRAFSSIEMDKLEKSGLKLTTQDKCSIQNLLNVPNIFRKYIKYDGTNYKICVYVPRISIITDVMQQMERWLNDAFPNTVCNTYRIASTYKEDFNKEQLNRFLENKSNCFDVMVSVNKISEGFHTKNVHTVVMLRRTSSNVVFNQQLGRAVNDNEESLILDLVDNGNHLVRGDPQKFNIHNYVGNHTLRLAGIEQDDCYCILHDEMKPIIDILNRYNARYPDEVKEQVLDLYNKGYKYKDIANILNIETNNISYLLRGHYNRADRKSYTHRDSSGKKIDPIEVCEQNRDEIIRCVNQSEPYVSIAKRLKISSDVLGKWCSINGLKSAYYYNNSWNLSDDIKRKVKCLIDEGLKLREIADRMGLNYRNVIYIKKNLGDEYKTFLQVAKDNKKFIEQNYMNYTLKELIEKLHTTKQTVLRQLDELQISLTDLKQEDVGEHAGLSTEMKKFIADNCKKMTLPQIAQILDIPYDKVRKYVVSKNLKYKRIRKPKRNSYLSSSDTSNILKLYENGATLKSISNEYNVCISVIKEALMKSGIKFETPSITPEMRKEIISKYKEGCSASTIAHSLNKGRAAIKAVLLSEGFSI